MLFFSNIFKLILNVIFDKSLLAHGDQVPMRIWHNESIRASAPSAVFEKLCIPATVFFVFRIKHSPRSGFEMQYAHSNSFIVDIFLDFTLGSVSPSNLLALSLNSCSFLAFSAAFFAFSTRRRCCCSLFRRVSDMGSKL